MLDLEFAQAAFYTLVSRNKLQTVILGELGPTFAKTKIFLIIAQLVENMLT